MYNKCDHVTCPSEYALNELYSFGVSRELPATVISNGINTNYFRPNGESEKIILYVGRIMPEKCIETLIYASSLVKNNIPNIKLLLPAADTTCRNLKK
jgi:glycosyltransferase involved in cell wall biosynthesis